MPRKAATKNNRVYRETLNRILKEQKTSQMKLSSEMGYAESYVGQLVNGGYGDISDATLNLMALTLGVEKRKLLEVPVSPQGLKKAAQEAAEKAAAMMSDDHAAMIANMNGTMIDGFAMLHQDIQLLIEAMDRYWKPTEPKYVIKDKEQD